LRVAFSGIAGWEQPLRTDEFAERFAQVCQRFSAGLSGKVDESFACLPKIADDNAGAIETIIVAHRNLHSMWGIAPSLGFPATGQAARAAEKTLALAAATKRALTATELGEFIATLKQLRTAAYAELQTNAIQT
jgi:hypothetical protein